MKPDQKFCGTCGREPEGKQHSTFKTNSNGSNTNSIINENYVQPKIGISETPKIDSFDPLNAFQNLPERRGMSATSKNSIIGLVSGLVILVFVILIAGNSARAEPVTITIEMTIKDESCWDLSWGYGDIPNGQVIITVDGESAGFGSYSSTGSSTILGCKFTAYVNDVPSDGENYSVAMASGRRGTIYNTRAELIANDWTFSLSLN